MSLVESRNTQGNAQFLYRLAVKAPVDTVKVARSIAKGEERDVVHDANILLRANNVEINGSENIPSSVVPIIFVGNHPPIADTLLGSAAVTVEFAKRRAEFPSNFRGIKWMVAQALEVSHMPDGKADALAMSIGLSVANRILYRMHDSYGFIKVPLDKAEGSLGKNDKRSQALRIARRHLITKGGSQAVGIFPEGDLGEEHSLNDFHQGVGALVRIVDNITVVPFGLYRENRRGNLHVDFGKPLLFSGVKDRSEITSVIQDSVRVLAHKKS